MDLTGLCPLCGQLMVAEFCPLCGNDPAVAAVVNARAAEYLATNLWAPKESADAK